MSNPADPYFSGPDPGEPGQDKRPGRGELPLWLLWFGVYLVNMPIPIILALALVEGAGTVGMAVGIVLVFGIGCGACVFARRLTIPVILGGLVVALGQLFPILQVMAGSIGMGMAKSGDEFLQGLVATIITGGILLTAATMLGLLVGLMFPHHSRWSTLHDWSRSSGGRVA